MNNSGADPETDMIRAEAKQLLRELEALCTLVKLVDVKPRLARIEQSLATYDKTTTRKFVEDAKRDIEQFREHYGIKVTNTEIVEVVDWAEKTSGNFLPLLPKYIFREMFDHYERVMPNFGNLPEHTDIAVDSRDQAGPGKTAIYLLEAMLYEDMAGMFNLTKQYQLLLNHEKDPPKAHKLLGALCRGVVASAFYFVESYLNGIAFDHYVVHESALDQKAKEFLLEWDFTKNRTKHLSFRNKTLQYPRIILGSQHPPLDESNCPEMDFIIKIAQKRRDAIVHAAPRKYDLLVTDKRQMVYLINYKDAEDTVDNAVRLVRRIETIIRGNARRLSWLYDRSPDGFFPDVAFE